MTAMTDETSVVKPYYATEEAYNMGYDRFEDAPWPDDAEPSLEGFRQSAAYANNTLPRLRSMAGFWDSAGGTYTVEKTVAAVEPGCEEDEPAEARLVSSKRVFDALVDAWEDGAYDAMANEDREVTEDYW